MNPPVEIAAWLACLAFVVLLVNGAFKLVDRLKDRPSPSEVRGESLEKYVNKHEFKNFTDRNDEEHRGLHARIGGIERGVTDRLVAQLDSIRRESNEGRDKLHDRINEVLEAVSELRGTVNELKR